MRKIENFKKGAFTLAEVLLTLAVIGIVATMTVPTLISNYNKKIVETKLLKVYTTMNQAIQLSTIKNGKTVTWRGIGNYSATPEETRKWFDKYLAKYLKHNKVEQDGDLLLVYLADGSILGITKYIYDMTFYINSDAINNTSLGKNAFMFRFQPYKIPGQTEAFYAATEYSVNPGFEPYSYAWDGTYEGAKNSTLSNRFGCNNTDAAGAGALCTKLIQLNGWKIPDDYPFKF